MEGLILPLSNMRDDLRGKLAKAYPDTDFGNCLVLAQIEKIDKQDAPVLANALGVMSLGGLVVGLALVSLGLILFIAKRRRGRIEKLAAPCDSPWKPQ
jgi:hypothetical protein